MRIGYLLSIILIGLFSCQSKQGQISPNVVIIIGDDISWNDLGCYGNPYIKTPNIDQLAESGIVFENAYLTTSSCSPSRISIITGRYPHNTGAPELHMPFVENQLPFPELLQHAGYYTASAGKWHFSGRSYHEPSGRIGVAFNRTGGASWDGGGPGGEDRWVEWLQQRPKQKPFFYWLASHDAHRGWDGHYIEPHSSGSVVVPSYLANEERTREELANYYSEIERLDYYVGEVVNELKNQGVFENTLILIMADNGRPFPRSKTRLYDSGIKTPMILHWPEGIAAGLRSKSLISSIDIAPTLLELAGISIPESIQGVSFAGILDQPNRIIRDYVFAEHNWHDDAAHERMLRSGDLVYIRNSCTDCKRIFLDYPSRNDLEVLFSTGEINDSQLNIFQNPAPEEELYDLTQDPEQLVNLATNSAYAAELQELSILMDRWVHETGDTRPTSLTPDSRDQAGDKILKWIVDKNVIYAPGDSIGIRKDIVQQSKYESVIRNETAGSKTNATAINYPGPIRKSKIQ